MRKSLIVAMTPSGVIGKDNALPWPNLPGDLPRFRELTMGKPCIMGRKTYESLPKALDGRMNIVVSRTGFQAKGINVASSVLEAWIRAAESKCDESFVIGGGEVYTQAIHSCDRLYLTILSKEFAGDTRFNLCQLDDWRIIDRQYVDGSLPYENLILDRGRHPMVQFLTLERLEENSLPVPRYGTPHSAGLDFAACLTRPCMAVESGSGNKTRFWVIPSTHCNDSGVDAVYSRTECAPILNVDSILELSLAPDETVLVPLGWKCAFDNTCVLNMYVRSSVGLRGIVLANGTGIIDPDYRGELFAALTNRTEKPVTIKHGERIVQGILTHFSQGIIKEGKVDETVRGEGGLGSTGKMIQQNPAIEAIKQVVVEDPPPE